jgi:hypothetical protein
MVKGKWRSRERGERVGREQVSKPENETLSEMDSRQRSCAHRASLSRHDDDATTHLFVTPIGILKSASLCLASIDLVGSWW